MTRQSKINLIERLFSQLERQNVGNTGFKTNWEKYVEEITRSEKEHRGSRGRCGIGVPTAAKLFAVKGLLHFRAEGREYYSAVNGRKETTSTFVPEAKDIFHVKLEYFMASALWHEDKDKIIAALPEEDVNLFLENIDYVDLMHIPS